MKKKVAFQKEIEFPTMIGEVSAISLEHNLKFVDESSVEGELLLSGKYKLTEASRLEEDFSYKIPTEIALSERLDLSTAKIDIVDFYYEITNDATLNCNIELLVDGVELIDLVEDKEIVSDGDVREVEIVEEVRECDGDSKEMKEIELPKIEKEGNNEIKKSSKIEEIKEISEKKEIVNEKAIQEEKEEIKEKNEMVEDTNIQEKEVVESDNSLFINLKEEKETYGTFLVYIVRQNESINTIIEKYNTNIEEIEKYNNLSELNIGTKLIIPILND